MVDDDESRPYHAYMNGSPDAEKSDILNVILRFLAVAGVLAYVPSVYAAVREGLWPIAAVDSAAYALVVAIAFMPGTRFVARLWFLVGVSLAIGMVVLYQTGPHGAGYIWLLAATVLSALFGKTSIVIAVNCISLGFIALWGLGLLLGWFESMGSIPFSVLIIGTNQLVIGVGLSVVIRLLLDRLSGSITRHESLEAKLAAELEESKSMAGRLDDALRSKEALLHELHHRVKNNLQVVLSVMSMADLDDPNACDTVKRRVRALALVNELALARPDVAAVDLAELFKAMAPKLAESCFPRPPRISVQAEAPADIDPQTAGLAAIIGGDILSCMSRHSEGVCVAVLPVPQGARIELRYPPDIPLETQADTLRCVRSNPIVKGSEPELSVDALSPSAGLGPGVMLLAIRS